MRGLITAARWEVRILLGGLMLAILYRLLTGGIGMSGLLMAADKEGKVSFSPARAQMLMATVLTALYYLIQVINATDSTTLPPLPVTLVAVVGGSQLIYLAGKAWTLLSDKLAEMKRK
jgi:hypothetical protein